MSLMPYDEPPEDPYATGLERRDIRGDLDAERALLAACMETKTARTEARRHMVGRDFLQPQHEDVWDAMAQLDREGKPVDLHTVAACLAGTNALRVLPDLVGGVALPDNAGEYANIVRSWSTKRNVESEARKVLQEVQNPSLNAAGFAASVTNRFAAIRDSGSIADDITAVTGRELLDQHDDEPEWLIPGLLERRDRLMLTGEEGLGKSHMLRQFAVLGAAGIHPFDGGHTFEPLRTTIIDCENSWAQVRRKIRPQVEWCRRLGRDPSDRFMVDCTPRMDIVRDKDISRIHMLLDAQQPDLVVIGPLYRLTPRALQTDDDTAPLLAAIDTIRDRGCAVLIEAHAGHAIGKGGVRDLRPRGSSSLLGWPEFGYGMRAVATGYADLVQWRGPREERDWPQRMKRADGFRWMPHDGQYAYEEGA